MTSQGEDEVWPIQARNPSIPPQDSSTPSPPGPVDTRHTRSNWMGNASLTAVKVLMALLVLTLAGVFLGLWTFFAGVLASLIAGVLAFVFGFLGLVAALRGRATNRGKSIGGMAFSLLILLFIIWMFLQMMSGLS